eukprot:349929-Pelagomonas_calceolata.AAC.1
MASVPLHTTSNKSWQKHSAAGVFVCGITSHCKLDLKVDLKVKDGKAFSQTNTSSQTSSFPSHTQEQGPINNKRKGRRASAT